MLSIRNLSSFEWQAVITNNSFSFEPHSSTRMDFERETKAARPTGWQTVMAIHIFFTRIPLFQSFFYGWLVGTVSLMIRLIKAMWYVATPRPTPIFTHWGGVGCAHVRISHKTNRIQYFLTKCQIGDVCRVQLALVVAQWDAVVNNHISVETLRIQWATIGTNGYNGVVYSILFARAVAFGQAEWSGRAHAPQWLYIAPRLAI